MLRLESVSKIFPNGSIALEQVNLRIDASERVAILGSSGCGKSTLLRVAAGLSYPNSGRVLLHDRPVERPQESMGFIFQEPRLMPWLNLEDNVAFAIRRAGSGHRAAVQRALMRVGLSDYAHYYPKQLSGGMAQRAAIARALAAAPELILLDEPFSALDPVRRADLQEHFLQLWRNEKLSTLLVTHDVEEAIVLADRILVMHSNPGRIIEETCYRLPLQNRREAAGFEAIKRQLLQTMREAGGQSKPTPLIRRG